MLGYAKIIKDLLMKMRTVSFELSINLHLSRAITFHFLMKNGGSWVFFYFFTVGAFNFSRVL